MSSPTVFQKPNSSVWHCRFSHKVGEESRQCRLSTGETDEQKAKIAAQRIFQEITGVSNAGGIDPANDDPRDVFTAHLTALERIGRNRETIANYSRYAKRFEEYFHDRVLGSITRADVERWRDWLLEQKIDRYKTVEEDGKEVSVRTFAERTISKKLVKEYLSWLGCVYKHFRMVSPTQGVARPQTSRAEAVEKIEYFTPDEMKSLFDKCSSDLKNSLLFLAYTGCRIGGLMSIRNAPECIHNLTKSVWVVEKGSKPRLLVLDGSALPAWEAIQSEIARRQVIPGDYVFDRYNRWVDKRLRVLCTECGIPIRSPHKLRHTFATHALMLWGWEIGVLAKWLGHEDISTTYRIYGHLIRKSPPHIGY